MTPTRPPAVFAHRGACRIHPENSIEAFEAALAMGADGVELDVRPSGDGHLVVHHDPELEDGRRISQLTWRELPARVPLLEPVLRVCGAMLVNIEVKNERDDPDFDPNHTLARDVVNLLRRRKIGKAALVSSFDLSMIARVRAFDSEIRTALLTRRSADAIEQAADAGHVAIHPNEAVVDRHYVTRAHDAGLAVNVWTVDDPERIRQLAELGVDGVITNVPDIAIAVLESWRTPRGSAEPPTTRHWDAT